MAYKERKPTQNWKFCGINETEKTITWYRHGRAAQGEPKEIYLVRHFHSLTEMTAAWEERNPKMGF